MGSFWGAMAGRPSAETRRRRRSTRPGRQKRLQKGRRQLARSRRQLAEASQQKACELQAELAALRRMEQETGERAALQIAQKSLGSHRRLFRIRLFRHSSLGVQPRMHTKIVDDNKPLG